MILSYSGVLLLTITLAAGASSSPQYVPDEIIVKFRDTVAERVHQQLELNGSPERLQLSQGLDRLNSEYKPRVIAPLFEGFRDKSRRLKSIQAKSAYALTVKEKHILQRLRRASKTARLPNLEGIYKIQLDLRSGQSILNAVKHYQESPDVEYAELNYIVSVSTEPNDPLYPVQWPLQNTGQMYPASGRYNPPPGSKDSDIDAPAAWNFITGAPEMIVAVLDTGIDYTHRDLDDNMWINQAEANGVEGVDDDNNGYTDDIYGYDFANMDGDPIDDHGHGTHCAGIIGAEGDNNLDISGVCWNVQIMGVKFMGSNGRGDISAAAEAIYYAVENGADVLSNSWGFLPLLPPFPKFLEDAFDYAYSQGVISVASAGNSASTQIDLPAWYDNVISVAATDSNDQKAIFSNYGYQVDMAAPGVDVLSLRAANTSRGTVYNNYTTILSGTSMACPHVSAAIAMILSYYPEVDIDQARDIIFETTDYIDAGISTWGRLNLYNAIWYIADLYAGDITFTSGVYSCADTVHVLLNDLSLVGNGVQDVNISTSGGDSETLVLSEANMPGGVFSGTIDTDSGEPNAEDGILQLSHGVTITVTYEDQDDGSGNSDVVTSKAVADCEPPSISNVQIYAPGPEPIVTFETSEPTTASVRFWPACCAANSIERTDYELVKHHTITLAGVVANTDHLFVVTASDVVGNEATDDNGGTGHAFTTTGPGDMHVPTEYSTIEQAVDEAWDGSIVWVADGLYTGQGNRDIDFKARAITLRSENGPDNCIIDCDGDANNPHYAFHFHNGEEQSSIVSGFTITNGYSNGSYFGGAITCYHSSPTITGCHILNSQSRYGGAVASKFGFPKIEYCTMNSNRAVFGGAISSDRGGPKIKNCIVAGNNAFRGGGFWLRRGSPRIVNSTICGNIAESIAGAIYTHFSEEVITNCIIWDNNAPLLAQLRSLRDPNYCCIQDWAGGGLGNITEDPCFAENGYWDSNDTPADTNDDFWMQGDYHPKSEGWRWYDREKQWVWDDVTSRCIDAGNPGSLLGDEQLTLIVDPTNRFGWNLRINMGAYGGTEQAAMPGFNWALRADLNNDGTVDYADLAAWTMNFLDSGDDQPGDLNRDNTVNLVDFAIFMKDWARQTIWWAP